MELRTGVTLPVSEQKITFGTPVMFLGSCFANEIGYKLASGKLDTMVNPHGTLFNPFSVAKALERFAEGYQYTAEDIFHHNNRFMSLDHHTSFSSYDRDVLIERLNEVSRSASEFLRKASFLFITFGTSYLFTLKEDDSIVANCHKLPSLLFDRRQASFTEIADRWRGAIKRVREVNPGIRIWFTVSPVRHLSDGAHGNQISKSHLLLAIEEIIKNEDVQGYFPAYEIFMDDLRDYRYYDSDMVHPSATAIEYTWERFASVFIESPVMRTWNEASRITRAMAHRITGSREEASAFGANMLEKIRELGQKVPGIDFTREESYFKGLAEG